MPKEVLGRVCVVSRGAIGHDICVVFIVVGDKFSAVLCSRLTTHESRVTP